MAWGAAFGAAGATHLGIACLFLSLEYLTGITFRTLIGTFLALGAVMEVIALILECVEAYCRSQP